MHHSSNVLSSLSFIIESFVDRGANLLHHSANVLASFLFIRVINVRRPAKQNLLTEMPETPVPARRAKLFGCANAFLILGTGVSILLDGITDYFGPPLIVWAGRKPLINMSVTL